MELRDISALSAWLYTLINAFSVLETLVFLAKLAIISISRVKRLIIH